MLQTERIANGAVQQNMNLSEVKSNIIPVPTEQIQGFIGNKVREAERLKDEAQKIRKNFEQEIDELFGSLKNKDGKYIFVDKEDLNVERLDADYYSPRNVLAQKLVLVSSSEKKLLSDVAFITDGDHGSPAFVHEGVPFLRNKNVKKYLVDEKDIVFINPEYEEQLKSSRLRKNDLLLKKIGTVGDCAVFRGTTGNLNANSALIRLETNKLLPYFTCALLNSSVFKTIIEREAGGGVQMALSLGKLFNIQIPIFKLAIQEPINEKVKKYIKMMEHSKDLIQEAKQDVEDLIEGNFTMEDN
ncbi:MAG: restriction endonuclease subunit S [Halanaerobiales bacterium]